MFNSKVSIPISGVIHSVEKRLPRTGERWQVLGPFNNLITNAGMVLINTELNENFSGVPAINRVLGQVPRFANVAGLAVGTGTSEPSVTDTSLDQFLFFTTNSGDYESGQVQINSDLAYVWNRGELIFEEGEAVGNLTELGLNVRDGEDSSQEAGTIVTRQLFKDENGDPTTITKLSEEQLIITYELRMYHDLTASSFVSSGSMTLDGQTYNWELGPINMISGANNNNGSFWNNVSDEDKFVVRNGVVVLQLDDHNLAINPDWESYKKDWPGTSFSSSTVNEASFEQVTSVTQNSIDGYKLEFELDTGDGNFSNGIDLIVFGGIGNNNVKLNRGSLALFVDPPIPKTTDNRLSGSVFFSFERYEGVTE